MIVMRWTCETQCYSVDTHKFRNAAETSLNRVKDNLTNISYIF